MKSVDIRSWASSIRNFMPYDKMRQYLDPTHTYMRIQIATASSSKLVCMLHEQCSLLIRQSYNPDEPIRHHHITKAQNMLALLQRSLKINDPTSRSLFYLYDYCYVLLEDATEQHLEDALGIIDMLRDTFKQLYQNE